jgi:glycosyltransferase involved in cell wall biosynthesis
VDFVYDMFADGRPVTRMISRILHVASGDLWGGAEACVFQLCVGLRNRGLQVRAVVMNPGELARRLQQADVPTAVLDEQRQSAIELYRFLRRTVREFRPSVVHSHRRKQNILAAAAVMSVSFRPRLVKTIHGAPEHLPARRTLRSGIARLADRQLDRFFDARVAVSSELARLLQNPRGAPLWTIHNGIAAAPESVRTDRKADAAPRVIGFAGRFVPVKRVDLLLRTAAEVKSRMTTPTRFELAGDGPLLADLRGLSAQLQIDDIVSFIGFQSDLWPTLARWDALMLTSDHEGLPMVCLEALAAGLPVIARRVGGLSEIVTTLEQGCLIDTAEPRALAEATLSYLDGNAHAQRRSLLPHSFSAEAMASSYADLYARLPPPTANSEPVEQRT